MNERGKRVEATLNYCLVVVVSIIYCCALVDLGDYFTLLKDTLADTQVA